MSGNWGYYNFVFCQPRTMAVKTYAKNKSEPKVMLWIAMSPKGLLTPASLH